MGAVAAGAAMALGLAACARGGDTGSWVELEAEPAAPAGLAGTKWRLEDLAGKGVVDRVEATLEFGEGGTVSGHGSCNRFRGPVTISGSSIEFGALAATRMFCGEAVSRQETDYLAALEAAERYEVKDSFLYIYAGGTAQPLRFVRE